MLNFRLNSRRCAGASLVPVELGTALRSKVNRPNFPRYVIHESAHLLVSFVPEQARQCNTQLAFAGFKPLLFDSTVLRFTFAITDCIMQACNVGSLWHVGGAEILQRHADKARGGTNLVPRAARRPDYLSVLNTLTPVEERCGLLFKRDDLFQPFESGFLNGGKLRQVMTVLRECRRPGVITAASIHSPQIPLVAGVAHHLGLRCVAVVGGTRVTAELNVAKRLGAVIRRVASGRHRALFAEVARLNSSLGYQVMPYGVVSPSGTPACFIMQAQQTANLPDKLDTLVVTCGSGMSTLGILSGLWRFSKRVSEVVIVTTAPSRRETIRKFLREAEPAAKSFFKSIKLTYMDLFSSPGFRYERRVPYMLCGIHLHPLYEAKAFRHVLQRRDCFSRRTLFWIIGADLREPKAGEIT